MLSALRRRARFATHNLLFRMRFTAVSVLDVDPQAIRYIQHPELWTQSRGGPRRLAVSRLPGDWDSVDDSGRLVWSGRYEGQGEASRMIPIESFGFYQACVARFRSGADWQSTEWYRWLAARIASGEGVRRYETPQALEHRLALLDGLHERMVNGEYRSALERQQSEPSRVPRWLRRPPEWDEPVVNLGRGGRIAIEDGRHRLCIARVAGVSRVRVRVGALHPEAGA